MGQIVARGFEQRKISDSIRRWHSRSNFFDAALFNMLYRIMNSTSPQEPKQPNLPKLQKNPNRDNGNGQYAPKHVLICLCGHFEHTAAKYDGEQPCIADEFHDMAPCDCKVYRPNRSKAGRAKSEARK